MACGICKKEGHNSRTCPQRDKSDTLNINTTRKVHSKSSTSSVVHEEIDQTIVIVQDLRDLKKVFLKNQRFLIRTTNTVVTESVDSQVKRIEPVLLKDDTGKKILPRSVTQSRKKQAKQWLNSEALNRLDQGPSEQDGPGYIYIYEIKNPDVDDKNCYKIGLSKDLPSRRVKVQEKKNNEVYRIISSDETPFRYLTETTVHRQLHSFNTPKLEGDGKTEWFTGDLKYFKDTIKKIVTEVKMLYT